MTAGSHHREPAGTGLVGREAELARILQSAGPGQSTSSRGLLLLGEEGIGRSRLLRAAGEQAAHDGALVLSAHGWAVERDRPYACLRQLLTLVLDETGGLPEPQRRALVTVVAARPGPAPVDARPVQMAVRVLLQHLAASAPVLLTVDDIQDCDQASMDVIGSVIRHLPGRGVSVLLAARGEAVPTGLPTELGLLYLAPLTPRAAAALLDEQPDAPRGRRRLEVLEEARGNPQALLELCRLGRSAADRAVPGGKLPQLRFAQDEFESRLAALPAATQHALLYAALADPGEDLWTVMTALDTPDLDVWAPAEAAGIVTVADGGISFRHALVRRSAGARHPAQLRRTAYLALAEAAGPQASRARYWAAAALGPDESIAVALEGAAWDAQDAFTAAAALEQAARLSPGVRDRARRLAEALAAAHLVGDPDWVGDLYQEFTRIDAAAEPTFLAAAAMSTALSLSSFQEEAFDLLLDVCERTPPGDGSLTLALASVAAAVADQSALPQHRSRLAVLLARTESRTRAGSESIGSLARLDDPEVRSTLRAVVSLVATPPGSAARLLRGLEQPRLGALPDSPERLAQRLAVAWVAYQADEADACLRQYRKADAQLRTRKALGLRAWSLAPMADTLLATGRWTEADALLEESSDGAAVLGQSRVQVDLDALALTLSALRGGTVPDPSAAEARWRALDLERNRATQARILRARALAATAQGDWARAFRQWRALFDADGSPLHPFLSPRAIAELAVAAKRTGREEETARILARVRSQQGERPTTRMTLLLHHAAALVDFEGDPEQHFQLAVVNPESEQWPWERAQARLSYGVWLRRGRRPLEAREQLTAALEMAEQLGADPLAAAVRAELRASGAACAADPDVTLAELTAQQRQIVRLAASGLSNREIGEQLFLSPRTVGTHLYNVYPKLGVSRRHQLRDLLSAAETDII
ncbi:AAA family ATPase (plasmid) [Streptomyces sp. NBC_01340]|nr:AAA family ATPase [Streptomyces sp. NBC_01340]